MHFQASLKWRVCCLVGLVLAAGAAAGAAVHSFAAVSQSAPAPLPPPQVAAQYRDFETAAYILKERDGYVAVFSSNSETPLQITGIPVAGLPSADRALLAEGITAADRSALLRLLEDLGS